MTSSFRLELIEGQGPSSVYVPIPSYYSMRSIGECEL